MAVRVKNNELVLRQASIPLDIIERINRYDDYLEALFNEDYAFLRDASKRALQFLLNDWYPDLKTLAIENYNHNEKIRQIFPNINEYLSEQHFPLQHKKSCSLDLATGSGKSYLMFAISQIALCEGLVNRVLVLSPSLTIEEGLTGKFNDLNSRGDLLNLIHAVNPRFIQPEIQNANDTILIHNICIENIHATYSRTGTSVDDSFKQDGAEVLVLNDEAHHIYTGASDSRDKKWLDFLKEEKYGFRYIIGVSGTPYYRDRFGQYNQYFLDVIYRFSIKDATERGIVKKLDPKKYDEYKDDKGYQDVWALHLRNREKYGAYLKPLTIVVCASIADAIIEWKTLVDYIASRGVVREEAVKKVIWVTSGLPTSSKDKERIKGIPERDEKSAEQVRQENLALLKHVDNADNPVEWIVSVAMLTEGWDVKNVFLIVPHKQRAFISKLLIAQVLGRGLRVPPTLKVEGITPLISVCNHEKWTPEINDLYNEVAEIEDRLSWGYDEKRKEYAFKLYNLQYQPVETTTESKETPAAFTGKFGFKDQRKSAEYKQEYAVSGELSYVFEDKEYYETEVAVANLHAYLKDKDERLAEEWPKTRLKEAILHELASKGYEGDFLSKDNYHNAQRSFGSFFWELGKDVPRISLRPDSLTTIAIEDFPIQSFNEDSLRSHGTFYYTETTQQWYSGDESILFNQLSQLALQIKQLEKERAETTVERVKAILDEEILKRNEFRSKIILVPDKNFPSPLNALYVSFNPEIEFAKALFLHTNLFKSFIKSADRGFYYFPYSYKPALKGKTHSRQENFNPDFFLWMKDTDDVVVVEIKKEKDDQQKNKAKFREGLNHFNFLNKKLEENDMTDRYYLKFLSPEGNDISGFFQALVNNTYRKWKSILMEQLEG